MWETPPPDIAGDAVGDGQEILTPAALEGVLADFRSWLQQLAGTTHGAQATEEATPPIDLHTLLGQFVALRHDVNLQTKAARSQQELTGQALQRLDQALEALRFTQTEALQSTRQDRDEAVRPLLKTLLDVHDAFSLAEREIRRVQETVLPLLDELTFEHELSEAELHEGKSESLVRVAPEPNREASSGSAPELKRSWWQRLFRRHRANEEQPAVAQELHAELQRLQHTLEQQRQQHQQLLDGQQEHQEQVEEVAKRLDQLLDSVITGYRMSLQRLERALQQSGLEPMPCVGQAFDPEQMEAVAAVADTGRPVGEVIEEVRRGYRWHGRVFRYAQVSVAKS